MALWSKPSSDDAYGKLLKSMESSLKSTLDISKDTFNNSYTQSVLLSSIATNVREISLNVQNLSTSLTGSAERLSTDFSRSLSLIRSLNNTMEDLLERTPEDTPEPTDSGNSRGDGNTRSVSNKLDKVSGVLNKIAGYAKTISEKTSEYHDYTSDLLRYTGAGLEAVQWYRSELTQNTVGRLNDDVGEYFFNSTESYKTLTDIARSANIGSLEALEEISRPVLLAESALQTDVTRIAELFNKFYLRYNFSSLYMESMVDNILTYTANNQAQAASVTEGIYALSDEIAIYAGGDRAKISDYTDTLAKSLSWVESLGQDSATYTEDLNKIFSGAHYTDQGLRQILEMGGLNTVEAQELAKSGDFDTLIEALFTGRANWGKQIIDNPRFADLLPVYGLSEDELENAYGAYLSPNYQSMSQFNPEEQEAVETLDDHFVSWEDQFGNWASKWTDWVTRLEEKLGISFGDIGNILKGIAGILGVAAFVKGGGNILSSLIGGAGATSASGGILGGVTKMLPALGVGAIAAGGVAAILGGIQESVKKIAGDDSERTESLTMSPDIDISKPIYYDVVGEDESGNPVYGMTNTFHTGTRGTLADRDYQIIEETKAKAGITGEETTLELLGKVVAGTGWWGNEETPGWYKIPIIGSLGAAIEYSRTSDDWESKNDDRYESMEYMRYLEKEGVTLYKLLWSINSGNKPVTFAKTLFDNLGAYQLDYIRWGLLPTAIDESGRVHSTIEIKGSPYEKYDIYNLPEYRDGSNYIPHDQLAYIHEGEAVVPKKYNPAANPTDLDSIRERTSNLQEVSSEYYKESISVLREVRSSLDELKEIKEFLASWREDNITRETVKESISRLSYQRSTVSGYMPLQV